MNIINESMYKKDKISQKTFQNMKLILENCFQWFKHKYGGYGGHCESEYQFEIEFKIGFEVKLEGKSEFKT